jgi:hypothetical protein
MEKVWFQALQKATIESRCVDCGFLIEPIENDPDPSRCAPCFDTKWGLVANVIESRLRLSRGDYPDAYDPSILSGWACLS